MTIFRVKNYDVASIPYLYRLVLQFIYEREKMPLREIHLMQDSIVKWKKKIDLDESMGKLNEDHQVSLERLAFLLKKDEDGGFERQKFFFREYKIDWRKFYRLPEAYTAEGLHKAQEVYEEYKNKNPEQEDTGAKPNEN